MVSILKNVGVISCGFVLWLSLFNATQATAEFEPNPCADRRSGRPNLVICDEEKRRGSVIIKGEVLRINGDTLLIERFNGRVMRLHIDPTSKMGSVIDRGARIEAKVDVVGYQKRVLEIREIE